MDATTDDALEVIEEEAEAVALALDAPPRLARMLAERVALRLGGRLVYIAKRSREAMEKRNATICREFNGRNYDELAEKHELTQRQVRKIVKACPTLKPLGQGSQRLSSEKAP